MVNEYRVPDGIEDWPAHGSFDGRTWHVDEHRMPGWTGDGPDPDRIVIHTNRVRDLDGAHFCEPLVYILQPQLPRVAEEEG